MEVIIITYIIYQDNKFWLVDEDLNENSRWKILKSWKYTGQMISAVMQKQHRPHLTNQPESI